MKHLLPLCLLLLAPVVPAPACINDSATKSDEHRFVSGYDSQLATTSPTTIGVEKVSFRAGTFLVLLPPLALIAVVMLWQRQSRRLKVMRRTLPTSPADS